MAIEKRWVVKEAEVLKVEQLYKELETVPKAICRLLVLREIFDFESAKNFFKPLLEHLHHPFLMKDMDKAVVRILEAVDKKEKVMIYGDYDVDGTTAVAVVYMFLKEQFPEVDLHYYVPNRLKEGYGISQKGIDEAVGFNCSLMIALDCGIKANEQTDYAKSKGIDLIICDHHLPGKNLPDAFAILNPKQDLCTYPYKELSGCGIGFKLITAIALKENLTLDSCYQYLDLVATSTAADIVPMDGENRVLVYYGLEKANENPGLALKKIKNIATLTKDFDVRDLVFVVAPRINAAGRMDDARKAIDFFIEEDGELSNEKAAAINTDNIRRKEIEKEITVEAFNLLYQENQDREKKSAVLFQPHWHKGVIGIVASKVLEEYYRPTIILTESNGAITGSARSVKGFNIYNALEKCSDLLESFGGHFFAAGMTLKKENYQDFKERFEEVVAETITSESLHPEIEIDAELSFDEIDERFYRILNRMEPFGPANMKPVFVSRQVQDKNSWSKIVKEDHIRFVLKQQGTEKSFTGIGFFMAEKFPIVASGKPFDVVYTLDENEWRGEKSIQLKVLDVKPAE